MMGPITYTTTTGASELELASISFLPYPSSMSFVAQSSHLVTKNQLPHHGTLSIRLGNAAVIDGAFIGSLEGWRWMVVGEVIVILVVLVAGGLAAGAMASGCGHARFLG